MRRNSQCLNLYTILIKTCLVKHALEMQYHSEDMRTLRINSTWPHHIISQPPHNVRDVELNLRNNQQLITDSPY